MYNSGDILLSTASEEVGVLTKAFLFCIFAVEKGMFVGTLDWTGRKDLASLQTLPFSN
jgi:hypothetical protein